MDTPDLNEVATFVRVVQTGGFTAAARLLNVPKSTVSRRVARLEERLGITLLRRTTRTMTLTEAGQAYYDRIATPVDAIENAAIEASAEGEAPRGLVRLTAPTDMGAALLGPALLAFSKRYPEVLIEVDLSGRLVDMVAEGYDLALRAGKLTDSTLVRRTVLQGAAWAFASPDYLAHNPTPEHPDDLVDHPCVLFRGRNGRATWTLQRGDEEQTVQVRGPMTGSDFTFVLDATMAGAGVALLPSFTCGHQIAHGRLVRLLPEWTTPAGSIHLVHPPSRHLAVRVRVVRDFLIDWFAAWSPLDPPVVAPMRARRGPRGAP